MAVRSAAYVDFASESSFSEFLASYPNLVNPQTFSKAWGSTAFR